jgi:hypothetical protein
VWPDAQSARVSLMTAQLAQGEVDSAVALANAVESAPERSDPWWLYYGGDMRLYAQLVGRLRELR